MTTPSEQTDTATTRYRRIRVRQIVEIVLAVISGNLLIATLVNKEWIEKLTGLDPDQGSGTLEWAIVAIFGALTIVFTVTSVVDGNRLKGLRAQSA